MLEPGWRLRRGGAVIACCLAAAAAPTRARADVLWEATAAGNAGYDRTVTEGQDLASTVVEGRPGFVLMLERPRRVWRAAYLFAGTLTLAGDGIDSYSNALDLSLAAELSARSSLGLTASVTQGDTEFRLTARAPEEGAPVLREPESPALVTGTIAQTYSWESTERFRVSEEAELSATSRQDELDRTNWILAGSLGLERVYRRDALGVAVAPRLSRLRSLVGDAPAVRTVATSLTASWNRDLDPRWNAQVAAGAEHVTSDARGQDDGIEPTGSGIVRYFAGDVEAALAYRRGATASLETGAMIRAQELVFSGATSFGPARQLGVSAGWLRAQPLAPGAPARGDVYSADVGLVWGLGDHLRATARYALALERAAGEVPASTVHVAQVGLALRWGNTPYVPPVPTLGEGRVDRGDAVRFPGAERDAGQDERR